MARLNVRIRTALFSALMDQELAYFNATKTGLSGLSRCLLNTEKVSVSEHGGVLFGLQLLLVHIA